MKHSACGHGVLSVLGWLGDRNRGAGLAQGLTLEEDCKKGRARTQMGRELRSAAQGGVNPKEVGTSVEGLSKPVDRSGT